MENLTTRLYGAAALAVLSLIGYGQVQTHVVEPARATVSHVDACLASAYPGAGPVSASVCR